MKQHCSYFTQLPGVRHAFFESSPFSFRKAAQTQHIEQLADAPLPCVTLKQVHGNRVWQVDELWHEQKEGDGLVTNVPGLALGVFTADCSPVLFYDEAAQVIGICHAGWRGAKSGIIQETIKAMEKLGTNRTHLHATLGPTIQQQHYEVGPEFPDEIGELYETYFYPSPLKAGHHHFDLPRYVKDILKRELVSHVHDLGQDTFSSVFCSRRRTFANRQTEYGDSLSAIVLV